MDQVFISHSSRDRQFVESEIVPLLRGHTIRPWYSADDISVASRWEKEILKALRASQWFLVVLTPDAVASEWVQAEVHWAIENRRDKFVPVMLKECDPASLHLHLSRYQHVDFRDDLLTARRRLLSVWGISPQVANALEVRLCVDYPGAQGRTRSESGEIRVLIDGSCVIGRHPGAGIRLMNELVSSNHAVLKIRENNGGKTLWLADLGTANGTYCNGVRLTELTPLAVGDSLAIGEVTLTIEDIRDQGASQSEDAGDA